MAVAIATAAGVFITMYQRRHGSENIPAVRQAFIETQEIDRTDFGLQNFGPGPALYLQVVVTDENDEVIFSLKPRERPLHLLEGEALGFLYDERLPNDDPEKSLIDHDEGAKKDDMIYLYYSYVSETGIREPRILNGTVERADECIFSELKSLDMNPRRMETSRIQDECRIS